MDRKPFSEACERNKQPILERLRLHFAACTQVLEIGSGSGQHALHFAAGLPHLVWQPSEVAGQLDGIHAWMRDLPLANMRQPLALDVCGNAWPQQRFDGVFSANTLHIMAWSGVMGLFRGISNCLAAEGVVAIYGPFNYAGSYTSVSNATFDDWLRTRDPASGIRDVEAVQALAHAAGLAPLADYAMPANNRLLVWQKQDR